MELDTLRVRYLPVGERVISEPASEPADLGSQSLAFPAGGDGELKSPPYLLY